MIILLAGLPGTGKSTLAQALAPRLSAAILNKDALRAALFEPPHIEYSSVQDDFCQDLMLRAAAWLLAKNSATHILLDGRTFSREYQRQSVFEFCDRVGVRCAVIECICPEATATRRIEEAAVRGTHPATNRTPALYRQVRDLWEPIASPKCIVDTEANLDMCVEHALAYLNSLV